MPQWLPHTGRAWANVVALAAGGLVGWLMHPSVWLIAGPFRWLRLLLVTAAQESGYNADAVGDDGASVGILQFQSATWSELGHDPDDRTSPFRQGRVAAQYVAAALTADGRWYYIAIPLYGVGILRHLWTHGLLSADTALRGSDAEWTSTVKGAAVLWGVVLGGPALWCAWTLFHARTRKVA